jgi:hypothetical protein
MIDNNKIMCAIHGHQWDRDGERCTVCGDKDWYASTPALKDQDNDTTKGSAQ